MTKPDLGCSVFVFLGKCVVASCLAPGCFAYSQTYYHPNQEVRISDLPSVTAKSRHAADVLAASAETVFRDKEVCCGKNSALENRIEMADPKSLKDVGDKLRGRQLLSDGRPILVEADFVPAASANAGLLIADFREKQPLLMEWNSHLYVVYGVIYDETLDASGVAAEAIHKLLLLDTRFSDERRDVVFDRLTDDWGKVEGVLLLKSTRQ